MSDTLQLPATSVVLSAFAYAKAGGVSYKLKGKSHERLAINSLIVLHLTSGIGEFAHFLDASGHTTVCKQGIRLYNM